MSAWVRLRALPATERRTLLGLMLLLPAIHLGLRVLGYTRTRALVEQVSEGAAAVTLTPQRLAWAERIAQLANIAGRRGMVQATCLRQSLAVLLLLRRAGLRPDLRLGVDRQGAAPDMHAWVELGGKRLAQADARHRAFRR